MTKGKRSFNFGKQKGQNHFPSVLKKSQALWTGLMRGDFPLDTSESWTQVKLRGFINRKK